MLTPLTLIQVFDQFVNLSKSEEREEAAVCLSVKKDERSQGGEWRHRQRDREDFPESMRSLMKIMNKMGAENTASVYSNLDRERR